MQSIREQLCEEIKGLEINIKKLKALKFENFQPFDHIYNNYVVGEAFEVLNIGCAIVTYKDLQRIKFVTIVKSGKEWLPHWQDVDKIMLIKKGIFYDMLNEKEHLAGNKIFTPAMQEVHFKSLGNEDLILEGEIYKNEIK